jgi:polyferredoxin
MARRARFSRSRRSDNFFDSPLLVGIAAILAVGLLNAVAFNVPLIPIPAGDGQAVALSFGFAGIPLLAVMFLALLFVRRRRTHA